MNALAKLAQDNPEQYCMRVMDALSAFICDPPKDMTLSEKYDQWKFIRKDVQRALGFWEILALIDSLPNFLSIWHLLTLPMPAFPEESLPFNHFSNSKT